MLAPRMVLNMYEQRFGLHRKPFQTVTKEQDFFASSSFGELLPGIVHALQTDLGVAVLTGPAGVGKSVSLEQIQRHIESKTQTLLLRGGSLKGSTDLLYLLHRKLLKIQPTTSDKDVDLVDIGRRYEVVERLERVASFWGPLTILLDDAHLICGDVFAELRSLLEEGHDGQRFARLLIAGPLLLEEVLAESENSHFARKIRTHAFLQPLRSDESIQYLKHLYQLAGGDLATAFESGALELISAASDGIPQCLNLLADESLMVCEENDKDVVTREIVNQALSRLQHLPYSWNVSMISVDDEDDFDEPASQSSGGSIVADNAIEFGAFPSDDSSSSRQSSCELSTDGVIEIGGPTCGTNTSSISEPTFAESTPTESTVQESSVVECSQQAQSVAIETSATDELIEIADFESRVEVLEEDCCIEPSDLPESNLEDATEISVEQFADLEAAFDTDETETTSDATASFLSADTPGLDDIQASDNNLADFVDEEIEERLARLTQHDEVAEDNVVSNAVRNFEPWAPAGHWPAEQVTVELVEAELVEAELVETKPADTEQPLLSDVQNNGPDGDTTEFTHANDESVLGSTSASQSSLAEVSTEPAIETDFTEIVVDGVLEPVIDRFTLAEFGQETHFSATSHSFRSEVAIQDQPLFNSAPAWPPTTGGLAPLSQIPVSGLDDDYAELLNDLGLLIDATSERDTDTEDPQSDVDSQSSFESSQTEMYGELLVGAKGPEGTIEELQHLIQEEQKLDETTTHDTEETATDAVLETEDATPLVKSEELASEELHSTQLAPTEQGDDSHAPFAAPQFFSMDEVREASTGDVPDRQTDSSGSPDARLDIDPHSPTGHDPDVVAFQQIAEERDEWYEQQLLLADIENEEQDEQQSLPAVLRQARQHRQRVLTIGLRQAAGAETVSETKTPSPQQTPDASLNKPAVDEENLPISLLMLEATEESNRDKASSDFDQTAAQEETKVSGFTNLFTRLRRRRGQAS